MKVCHISKMWHTFYRLSGTSIAILLSMSSQKLPEEIYITYRGEKTRVHVNDTEQGPTFSVFLSNEEGHVTIYSSVDKEGNECWFEGDQSTERANEIGVLLESAADEPALFKALKTFPKAPGS